ncbi:putative PHD type zinc finger protein with BAH domain-containing protein [Geranomyces michiganensis]|nr:putative PHD type zinc finger protein with BAH domain-containing protein [Geranomyces michiganensis]
MKRNTRKTAAAAAAPAGDDAAPASKSKARAGNGGSAGTKPAPTQITAKDGTVYKVDDYAYLAPDAANEPYYVGRIMEFVKAKSPGKDTWFARMGWFYRPKDVLPGGAKKHHDPRLLLASMHTDLNPISTMRGTCDIRHVYHIKDLEEWKAKDDTFYYDQLYDRYTHRVYDAVPLAQAKNLPNDVSRALSDYEFLLVEAGKAADFTERRVCNSCNAWCNPDEPVVKCVLCRGAFHLGCVGLGRKPPKGYAWQCAKCNKKAVEDAEEVEKKLEKANRGKPVKPIEPVKKVASLLSHLAPGDDVDDGQLEAGLSSAATLKVEDPVKEALSSEPNNEPKAKPLWPYRYFGEYSQYRDTLGMVFVAKRLHHNFLVTPEAYFAAEESAGAGTGRTTSSSSLTKDDLFADLHHPRPKPRVGKEFQAELPDCVPRPKQPRAGDPAAAPPSNNGDSQATEGPQQSVSVTRSPDDRLPISTPMHARVGAEYQAEIPECSPRPAPSSDSASNALQIDAAGRFQSSILEITTPKAARPQSGNSNATVSPEEDKNAYDPSPGSSAAANAAAKATRTSARGRTKKKGKGPAESDPANPDQSVSHSELIFSKPDHISAAQMKDYFDKIRDGLPVNMKASDFLYDRGLRELHKANYDIAAALDIMLKLKQADYGMPVWSDAEIKAFEGGIMKYGTELNLVQKEVPSKKMTEVIAFFYKWKKGRRYAPVYSQFCKKYRPGKRFKGHQHVMDGADDPEGNISGELSENELPPSPSGKHKIMECSNCFTHDSERWKFRQKDSKKEIMCQTCSVYFLKYGAQRHVSEAVKKANRETAAKKVGKRKRSFEGVNGSSEKESKKRRGRGKGATIKIAIRDDDDDAPLSPSPISMGPRPCAVCADLYEYETNEIISCIKCSLRVHRDCYGVPTTTAADDFKCARCVNIETSECSILYDCTLCPMVSVPRESALKRTIGNNWAHVSCAMWISEVKFGDPATASPVECIGLVDKKRWSQTCTICKRSDKGACITCTDRNCPTTFHVSCARYAGWDLSIELGRSGKSGTYELQAVAHCQKHDRRGGPLLSSDALKAIGSSIAHSSLHHPTKIALPTYFNKTPADQIDHVNCRPRRLNEFIYNHKEKPQQFDTGGRVKAFSMSLQSTCSCHICVQPPAGVPTPAATPVAQKSNVILISLGSDGPKYVGRKGSNGLITGPATLSDAHVKSGRRKSSGAKRAVPLSEEAIIEPQKPTGPTVSRKCAQCFKTTSPAWWDQEVIWQRLQNQALAPEIVTPTAAQTSSSDPPTTATSPASSAKRKASDALEPMVSPDTSGTSANEAGGADGDGAALGRGMRKRRKSAVMLDLENELRAHKAASHKHKALVETPSHPASGEKLNSDEMLVNSEKHAGSEKPGSSDNTNNNAKPNGGGAPAPAPIRTGGPTIRLTLKAPIPTSTFYGTPANSQTSAKRKSSGGDHVENGPLEAETRTPSEKAKTEQNRSNQPRPDASATRIPVNPTGAKDDVRWICHGCMWALRDSVSKGSPLQRG